MSKTVSFLHRLLNSTSRQSDADLELELAEDKRLDRLGIDTNGDPVDMMLRLRKKQQEFDLQQEELNEQFRALHRKPAEDVDNKP